MLMPIPASIGRSMGVPAFAPHLLNAPVICRTGERLAAGIAEVGAPIVAAGPFENPDRPVGSAFGAYRPNTGFIRSLLMGSLAFPVGRLQCRYPRCRPARLDDLGNLWLPYRAQRVTEGVAHLTLTGAQRICSPDGRNLLLCR
jgi:hypothetical protein